MLRLLARSVALSTAALLVTLFVVATASAATVSVTGTVATYAGDADADLLNVGQSLPTVLTFDARAKDLVAGAGCALIGDGGDSGDDVECNGPVYTALVVNAGAGDDNVDLREPGGADIVTIPSTVNGGTGADALTGGSGADTIDAGPGAGNIWGFAGNDTIIASSIPGEFLVIHGNEGDDSINVSAAASSSAPFVTGDDGSDTFTGGPADSTFQGGIGNDVINGGAGNETFDGETGSDTLNGGGGDDHLRGGSTWVGMGEGITDGADSITGGDGIDTVSYESRTQAVTVNLSVSTGNGQSGENDTIAGVERINGGNGPDVLTGDAAANTIQGFAGADVIDGAGGYDQLRGGLDADTLNAASDVVPDLVDCGNGFTATVATATDGDTANLDYVDVLDPAAGCETVNRATPPTLAPQGGTAGDDTIVGTSLADLIFGLAGNDTIRGGDGNDELHGNAGADSLFGENGHDELVGNADADTLRGGDGNDQLAGRGGADRLFGDNGTDELDGGADSDALAGGNGNDDLDGRDGIDSLLGQGGADDLRGGRGADVLSGGAGNDLLVGGANPDRVDGGPGLDWIFARDGARDTITCTKVNLRVAAQRRQRDYVIADRLDRITNRASCARVVVL